jgi:small GTP-binding protein
MSSKKVPIVAIVGRANVGKSSLFNAVIGRREAIVANEPGTTRDNVTAKASHEGKDFWLVDTAGLKSAEDEFELSIQEQITEATAAADVILVTVEADVPITDEDRRVAKMALKSRKPVILAVNKIDKNKKANSWTRLQSCCLKYTLKKTATASMWLCWAVRMLASHPYLMPWARNSRLW